MLHFFVANSGTIIVSIILLGLVGLAVHNLISDKRKGKTTCGCGCANCPSAGICHSGKNKC